MNLYDWSMSWKSYLKKIPKSGLDNLTKVTFLPSGKVWDRGGEPTLPRRLRKIIPFGIFGLTDLPFFHFYGDYVTTHEPNNKVDMERQLSVIKECTKLIIEKLEELYGNLDSVTVLNSEEKLYWKEKIRETKLYIIKQSGWIGMSQDGQIVELAQNEEG